MVENTGCHNCKWAVYNRDAFIYNWIRDLFHRHVWHPWCAVAMKHPLFKQKELDHRGVLLSKCRNKGLLEAVSKKFEANTRYTIAGSGDDFECLMNKERTCPFFHKRYTKLTTKQLEELEAQLKLEYIL
jgi:hypothetical protein